MSDSISTTGIGDCVAWYGICTGSLHFPAEDKGFFYKRLNLLGLVTLEWTDEDARCLINTRLIGPQENRQAWSASDAHMRHLVSALEVTDGDTLDVELLLDAEEVAVDISTAKRLVTANSRFEVEESLTHFSARSLVGDDDANGSLVVRNNTDVGTSCALASDAGGNYDIRILDGNSDLLWDQSGRVGVALKLERGRASLKDRFEVRVGSRYSRSGSSSGCSGSASGKGEDGKRLEKHGCVRGGDI